MTWTELLTSHTRLTFAAADGLLDLVDDDALDWRPATGKNWMTTGQLLLHLTFACGYCCRGFVTGDWTPPEGYRQPEEGEEVVHQPAETLPAVASVARARELLAEDLRLALTTIEEVGEERLTEPVRAPWEEEDRPLGEQFLLMIQHLAQHKGQLFYYLKLQGKPVDSSHLWGM